MDTAGFEDMAAIAVAALQILEENEQWAAFFGHRLCVARNRDLQDLLRRAPVRLFSADFSTLRARATERVAASV